MAIGESKTKGLFSHFKGLQSGSVGSFNTQRDWNDVPQNSRGAYTAPLIKKEIMQDSQADPTLSTTILDPVTHRLEDVARITKLIGTPQGIKWEAHMAELQTLQNQLETKRSGGPKDFKTLLANTGKSLLTGIGLTASTLAQVAVGGHLGEHQTPFVGRAYLHSGGTSVMGDILASVGVGDQGYVNGGQLALNGAEITGRPIQTLVAPKTQGYRRDGKESRFTGSKYGSETSWDTTENVERVETAISSEPAKVAGSKYGTPSINNNYRQQTHRFTDTIFDETTIGIRTVYDRVKRHDIQDYSDTAERARNGKGYSYDWKGRVTNPTYSDSNNYTNVVLGKVDRILHGGIYQPITQYGEETGSYVRVIDEPGIQKNDDGDYLDKISQIPFEIVSFDPNMSDGRYLYFQANLDSLDDSYTGEWSSEQYVGRADKFHIYTGFTRDINFAFKVVARRQDDLQPIYEKLNALAGTTAPNYNDSGVFMKGTISRITIGDYIKKQYGFFKSVKISWKTDYPWEIGIDEDGKQNRDIIKVPHMLDVSVGFTPIHTFVPRNTSKEYFGY